MEYRVVVRSGPRVDRLEAGSLDAAIELIEARARALAGGPGARPGRAPLQDVRAGPAGRAPARAVRAAARCMPGSTCAATARSRRGPGGCGGGWSSRSRARARTRRCAVRWSRERAASSPSTSAARRRWRRAAASCASAIVKTPVEGPVAARGVNLGGDEQADRSTTAAPTRRSTPTRARTPRSGASWSAASSPPACFGENLTLAGVDVSGARIGERWRIGTVELRVAGPRVPCFKLEAASACRASRGVPPRRPPGAYLAIAEEGELQAGDAVEIVHRPDHEVVALVIQALLLDRAPRRARARAPDMLPSSPAGTRSWRMSLDRWSASG